MRENDFIPGALFVRPALFASQNGRELLINEPLNARRDDQCLLFKRLSRGQLIV